MILCHRLTTSVLLLLVRMPWKGLIDVDAKTLMCRDVFPSMTRTPTTPCVESTMYPGGLSNTAIVLFEIKRNSPTCLTPLGEVTVALMVVNDLGYPCGKPPESFTRFVKGAPTFCTLPNEFNVPWNSPLLKAFQVPCFYHEKGKKNYLQPVSESQVPSLFVFKISKGFREQSRIVWQFEVPSSYTDSVPQRLSVVGEMLDKKRQTVFTFGSNGTATLSFDRDVKPYAKCEDNPTVNFNSGTPKLETSPDFTGACEAAPEECQNPPPKIVTSSVFSCRGWKREVERVVGSTSKCVTLVVGPTRQENSVVIGLVMDPTEGGGACGGGDFDVEAWLLQANNEEGYPVGRINETFPVDFPPEDACVVTQALDIGERKNVPCFFHESEKDKYIQQVDEVNMPSLFYGKTGVAPPSGKRSLFAHIWKYSQPPSYAGRHPTQLHFQAEVFLPKKKQIYVLRAATPLSFTYLPSPLENSDPNTLCYNPKPPRSSVIFAPTSEPVDPDAGFLKACKASEKCPIDWDPTTTSPTTPTAPPGPVTPTAPPGPVTPAPQPPPVIVDPEPTPSPPEVIIGDPPPPTRPPPKMKRRRLTNVYEGCSERTKGCIVPTKGQHPRACLSSETCELVIAFQRQDAEDATDDVIVIELYHPDPGDWFAMGINFSEDIPRMSDTFVLECVDEGEVGGPVIYNSYNAKGKYGNKRYAEDGAEGAQKIIQKKETYRRGRELYCRFHLATKFDRTPMRVDDSLPQRHIDLNRHPVFVVAAWGSDLFAGPHGNLRKHKPEHKMVGQRKLVLSARYAPTASQKTYILQHGVFTTWAFLFALPTGNFLARFLKETFPNIKICRRIPLWLFLHVGLMTSTLALVVAGMAVEIYGHVGWVSLSRSSLHTVVGGATGGLLLANFFFGFFVNVSHHGKRNLPGIAHSVLGLLVQVGGCVLICSSGDLSFGNSPCHVKWIVGAWVFSFLVAHAIMGYHYCWVDWVVGLQAGRSLAVSPIGVLTEAQVNDLLLERRGSRKFNTRARHHLRDKDVISAPGAHLRLGGFALFVMISLMYAAWTTTILATNERGPCVPPNDNLDEEQF